MESIVQDLQFGLRQLRKAPALTLAAILTLALGIGGNATVFTWFKATVINPLPGVPSTRELITVRWRAPSGGYKGISWLDYLDYRARNRTLEQFAVATMEPVSLGDGTQPERVWAILASANYFRMLQVRPELGRTFASDEDENPGGHPVAVISHRLWVRKYGGDRRIIGREILLDKRNFTVIGVTPEEFEGSVVGLRFDLWLPITMADALTGGMYGLSRRDVAWAVFFQARVKSGVDRRTVRADLDSISAQLAREFHQTERYNRAEILPISEDGGGDVLLPVTTMLMAVVAVVLLIACANVANLLLARAGGRRREIAIRLALGVGRARLIRQLLIENSLLAMGGLAAALAVLPITMTSIQGFAPPTDLPAGLTVRADASVYAFSVAIAAMATLLFGLAPALRASSPDVVRALKEEPGGSAGRGRSWGRDSLVVAQVALSLVLLVSAGLLLKTLTRVSAADPGFDSRHVLLAGIDLVPNGYDAARGESAIRQMTAKLAAIPGVTMVTTVRSVPLGFTGSTSSGFQAEGYVPGKDETPVTNTNVIGADYFATLRTALVEGREFTPADSESSQPAVVVNETFARRYLPRGAVGRRIEVYGERRVVVGVVRDSNFYSLDDKPRPWVYLPLAQSFASQSNFLVRTAGDPQKLARAVEAAIHQVDPALPVYGVRPLKLAISASYFGQRMGSSFVGLFGFIALTLAAIGLYGVLAYTVSQRSREVGIRIALGASRSSVLGLILGQGLRLAACGLAAGVAITIGVTRLMRALLLDVSPTDAPTLIRVACLLALVSVVASLIPAHRATRIDPIVAIRHE